MSIIVICPSCNEENYGSVLLCKKCQTSLIGISRQKNLLSETESVVQQNFAEGNVAGNAERLAQPDSSIINGHANMLKNIRSWGVWSLLLGALHIFTSGFLSAPWGILLIMVGLASFYFQSASMFIIYAITLGWAAFSNLIGFETGWVMFALYQFFLAFRVFQQYRLFRDVEGEYAHYAEDNSNPKQSQSNRASRFFPWLGSFFGCSSIIVFVLLILIVFIVAIVSEGKASVPEYFGFLEGLAVNFGILGASIGLASLLSKYRRKALAIIGLTCGVLTVLVELVLNYSL